MIFLQKQKLVICFIFLFLLMISGCAERGATEHIRIKKGPAPEIVAEDGKAKIMPAGYLKRRLRLGLPSIKNMIINDRQYIYITEKWFMDVLKWTEEFIELQIPDLDLGKTYPVAYDETFASLASNIANIAVARKYNLKGSVLIGLITATNDKPWGTIPGDGTRRVYVIGLTENDGIVYDIRTRQTVAFGEFPNVDTISGIMF